MSWRRMSFRWSGRCSLAKLLLAALLAWSAAPARAAEEAPSQWEQLFFPFPIVGAPPQLEQQVQLFNNYFRGDHGSADQVSAELAYIASPHLGVVLDVPYQIDGSQQPNGFQDLSLLVQYLAAGSLRFDDMIAVGLEVTFPTAQHGLGSGDYDVGPFIFVGQRLWHHLILELNATALLPVVHGGSARQLLGTGLLSTLLTPVRFDYPIYLQAELDSTTFLSGTRGLPPGATRSPAQTVFLAPELFIGPFASPLSDGTRIAAGVFFNLTGDREHDRIYSVTVALDIPNKYGY